MLTAHVRNTALAYQRGAYPFFLYLYVNKPAVLPCDRRPRNHKSHRSCLTGCRRKRTASTRERPACHPTARANGFSTSAFIIIGQATLLLARPASVQRTNHSGAGFLQLTACHQTPVRGYDTVLLSAITAQRGHGWRPNIHDRHDSDRRRAELQLRFNPVDSTLEGISPLRHPLWWSAGNVQCRLAHINVLFAQAAIPVTSTLSGLASEGP